MTLRERMHQAPIIVAPGVADTLGAALAARYGFEAVFLSGSAVSLNHLARPDIGLMSLTEMLDITRRIAERVDIPVIVDADSGFGNAYQVHRSVRAFELAGAAGIQIEDQIHDKAPQAVQSRPLIDTADMQIKLRAALDARRDDAMLISARSDAVFSEGPERAIQRAVSYAECGVDIVFVEGLQSREHRRQLVDAVGDITALLFNRDWPCEGVAPTAQDLEREGYAIALSPKALVQAAATAMQQALTDLAQTSDLQRPEGFSPPTNVAEAIEASDYINTLTGWSNNDEQ